MSEALINAQIKSVLEAVTGIGPVHAYERYPRSLADYFAMMKDDAGKVNGWVIHRESTISSRITLGIKGLIERIHTYRISGIVELDDAAASETALQALLEEIFTAFKAAGDLAGTCQRTDLLNIDAVNMSDLGELGADLYHIVGMTLTVYERVTSTYP
jgi:hypothetical protein